MRSLEGHVTARGSLHAQRLEPGTRGLSDEDTQGLRPDTQGLTGMHRGSSQVRRGHAGRHVVSAGKLERRDPANPAHSQQAYRAVMAGAAP